MADVGSQDSWSDKSLWSQAQIVIASFQQQSMPHKFFQFSENFIDEEIVDRLLFESVSENEETWLQSEFDKDTSLETTKVETWLEKEAPKANFVLSNAYGSNGSLVSSIGKPSNPYFTYVRQKRPNLDSPRLTIPSNILDHNLIGDGVSIVENESDSSMASSLLLDSHIAHFDKTGVLNFDDQTESESLQNCLNRTSSTEMIKEESVRADNQTIFEKPSSESIRKSFMPPIMGRSYTKLPSQQIRYDSPPPVDNLSDSLEDLNFNPKFSAHKSSEFDSRTYRKSAVKNREKLIDWSGSPFASPNGGGGRISNFTPVAAKSIAPNSTVDSVFKTPTPLNFDSSTFSRSQLKNRRAVPFSGFQIKNAALFNSDSPSNYETFTIAKQNNGGFSVDAEHLENSLDYITAVQTPSLMNLDLDSTNSGSRNSPFNSTHNVNERIELEKAPISVANCHNSLDDAINNDCNTTETTLNQTFDANQNISNNMIRPPTAADTLNSTFSISEANSYLRSNTKRINRLSVSHDNGLEKLETFNEVSRKSLSDSKPLVSRGLLKNSKLSLPVRRNLYPTNMQFAKQAGTDEEPNLNNMQVNASSINKSTSNLRSPKMKSGLRRPVSAIERCSEVKYYNLTDKKNVLNSTFCKSATNLSASYIVDKHGSAEDVSRSSVGSSSSSSVLSSSSYTCISASNGAINNRQGELFEPKKVNDQVLLSPPKSTSTPKANELQNVNCKTALSVAKTKLDLEDEQLNFQPFSYSKAQNNQICDETVLINNNPAQNRVLMNETLILDSTLEHPSKLIAAETTFTQPQRVSGLRMPTVRSQSASRLPTAVPNSSIPRFASRLPTFRMRIPAPIKK